LQLQGPSTNTIRTTIAASNTTTVKTSSTCSNVDDESHGDANGKDEHGDDDDPQAVHRVADLATCPAARKRLRIRSFGTFKKFRKSKSSCQSYKTQKTVQLQEKLLFCNKLTVIRRKLICVTNAFVKLHNKLRM